MMDGPRFVVGLQKVDDTSCFKDFFESDVLKRVKEEGQKAVKKHNRAVLIFDRKDPSGVFRIEPDKPPEEVVVKPAPVRQVGKKKKPEEVVKPAPVRKTKKKPEKKEVKKSKSSKYFD